MLLAGVYADYKFTYNDVGSCGSRNDSAIFRHSSLSQQLRYKQLNIPNDQPWPGTTEQSYLYMFVADEAFDLSENIMRPYSQHGLSHIERIFNCRLTHACRMME